MKNMEHYYVITGNEYGADLDSKTNFKSTEKQLAINHFNNVKGTDFVCILMFVDSFGNEQEIENYFEE